eukprot:Colp12_sorted_trinity150504_noHs@22106
MAAQTQPAAAHAPPKKTSFLTKLSCGAIGGIAGVSTIFPLDVCKTRLQNQNKANLAPGAIVYKNGVDCFFKIIKYEGVLGLYRGLLPTLVGVTPEKAIKMAMNDFFRERLQGSAPKIKLWQEMLAGAGAGLCQVVATNPMELIKINLQVAGATAKPGEPRPTAIGVIKQLGIRGVYKGTASTLLRDIPFSVVFFPSAANVRELGMQPDGTIPFSYTLLGGMVGGAMAAACSTPADVIKTRIQVTPKPGQRGYSGIVDCVTRTYKEEGLRAFGKGVGPRVMIISPLFAIAISVYEAQQRFFANA